MSPFARARWRSTTRVRDSRSSVAAPPAAAVAVAVVVVVVVGRESAPGARRDGVVRRDGAVRGDGAARRRDTVFGAGTATSLTFSTASSTILVASLAPSDASFRADFRPESPRFVTSAPAAAVFFETSFAAASRSFLAFFVVFESSSLARFFFVATLARCFSAASFAACFFFARSFSFAFSFAFAFAFSFARAACFAR